MTATAAEALELALWLHRAPSRRATLLGRPLPDGIGQLLRVAIGTPDQVAAASLITGESEGTILEAVRFYLQQILFHEDADAYRVLGLNPDATHAQAREHHRLLQQWLHPDRSGEDAWETVYASRINRAWGHLKTSQARAAYDATLGASAMPAPATEGGSRQGGEYQVAARPVPGTPISRASNRSRNLTIVVLLGCVGLLFLIATRRDEPPQWRDGTPLLSEATESIRDSEGSPIETFGAAFVDAIEPATLPAPPPMPTPAQEPTPVETTAATTSVRSPVAPLSVPVVASAPPANIAAPRPVPAPPVQTVAFVPGTPPPAAVLPKRTPAKLTPPKPAPPQVDPEPPAPVTAAAVPVPAASAPIPDAFDRMNQAQARARQVVAYLGDRTAAAPAVWNDLRVLRQAEQIRTSLHGRHAGRRTVRLDLGDPQWRLSADGARLESRYRAGNEQGSFGLDFTWRESQLLVRAVSLVPDA